MLDLSATGSIMLAVGRNMQTGGTNLLRHSKTPVLGSGMNVWGSWSGNAVSTYVHSDGFNRIRLYNTGATEPVWITVRSPYAVLPSDWLGRKITLSFDLAAMNWANVDHNMGVILYFYNSSTQTTGHRIAMFNVTVPGQAT